MTPARYDAVAEAARTVQERIGDVPDVAVVLGSGLGAFAGALEDATVVPYAIIPHWPAAKIVARTRVNPDQLFIVGQGANHPVVSNATPAGKDRNQRVELNALTSRQLIDFVEAKQERTG